MPEPNQHLIAIAYKRPFRSALGYQAPGEFKADSPTILIVAPQTEIQHLIQESSVSHLSVSHLIGALRKNKFPATSN